MLLLATLLVFQAPPLKPVPYYDPQGRLPSTYENYIAGQVDAPFEATTESLHSIFPADDNLVLIFVNATLYPLIQTELDTYVSDLSNEGFASKVIAVSGGKPADLRQILQVHQDSGLVGALMVGDLLVAWWEDGPHGEDYPLELFFTDLDGTWADNNHDGKYDYHSGNRAPDIWIGRVYASRLTYDSEEHLIKQFFQRNHAYRTGQLQIQHRGLVYNEITWYPHDHGMNYLYLDITMFNDENTTTAYHYKNQLRLGYEFVHLIAHSSPWVSTFFLDSGAMGGGSLFNFEIPALMPNAAFYFLNACMNARFTEKDNLGNWYLFAQPWGQVVMASTSVMYGVPYLTTVYRALDNDSCFGDAFLKWHKSNYSRHGATCILGDPTLKISTAEPSLVRIPQVRHQPTAPLDWTEFPFDSSNFVNGNPDIGCSDGKIRIVFDSGRKVRADTYWSWFNGSNFSQPESIAWHEYYDLFPACATDATGRFWVVWQSFRDYQSYDHFQLFSTYYYDGHWSSVQRVGPIAGYHDVQAALGAGSDDRVWCAFKSWRNGQADIWVSSAQNGDTWTNPTRLTDNSFGQISPCITVDQDNHPWVFWSSLANGNWHIQGRHYDGSHWLPMFSIDTTATNSCPRAAVDNQNRVWVVWHKWQNSQTDIYYAFWNGSNWTDPAPITVVSADDILADITMAEDGNVWACWQSKRAGFWDIYSSHYQDGWTRPQPVTQNTTNDYDPVIAADTSGNIWIAWASDRRNYWNIYAAKTNLTGITLHPSPSILHPSRVTIGPNPFCRQTTFTGPENFQVRIYSPDGRQVAQMNSNKGKATWAPRNFRPGLYIARITSPTEQSVGKLVYLK